MGSLIPFAPRARTRLAEFGEQPTERFRGSCTGARARRDGDPVVVLMAVSDETDFLDARIASILDQTWPRLRLVIRDHGGGDATRRILDGWRRHRDVLVLRSAAPKTAASLLDLLGLVDEGETVAFADEDALWHPNKVARALVKLGDAGKQVPALYCSRAFRGGDAATDMTPPWPRPPSFGNALVENVALGATVVLNPRAAARLRRAGAPAGAISAAWWSYLVTSAFGAIEFDDWASVLLDARAARSLERADLTEIAAQARGFLVHYGGCPRLRGAYRRLAESLARGSGIERRALAFSRRIYRQSAIEDARLRLRMLAGPWPSMERLNAGSPAVSARAA